MSPSIVVRATTAEGITHTRTFTDTHIYIEGNYHPRTARQQADDYTKARREAGCTTTETTRN